MIEAKRAELLIKIERAFKRVPYPDRKIGNKEELQDFLGKRWQEIPLEVINRNDTFFEFNKAGLLYYLPAYLTAILKHDQAVKSHVREAVVRELGYTPLAPDLCAYFSPEQQSVILEFFVHYLAFFPLPPTIDLPLHIRRGAEIQQKERIAQLQTVIDFWKSC